MFTLNLIFVFFIYKVCSLLNSVHIILRTSPFPLPLSHVFAFPCGQQLTALRFKMAENVDENLLEKRDISSCNNCRITFNQVKFVGIEYPGYIKDEKHMLETLGGEEAVSRTYSSPARRLEMSFRPEDPYCHAVCADRYSTANLLLRVKQRKKKTREGSGELAEVKYDQEILGIVGNTFK